MGHELYVSACGICHDAEHRATMVPNLRMLARETNADYWKAMIVLGKPGTLMPAFSTNEGGPLTDEQITSLVDYLVKAIPSASATQAAIPAPAMNTTTH
jgi:mono/diheme cytochrome c family protein